MAVEDRFPAQTALDLTAQERAVLQALDERAGRVVSRHELARAAGLVGLHQRRCDQLLVRIREEVGVERLITVRGRGWMLIPDDEHMMFAARSA